MNPINMPYAQNSCRSFLYSGSSMVDLAHELLYLRVLVLRYVIVFMMMIATFIGCRWLIMKIELLIGKILNPQLPLYPHSMSLPRPNPSIHIGEAKGNFFFLITKLRGFHTTLDQCFHTYRAHFKGTGMFFEPSNIHGMAHLALGLRWVGNIPFLVIKELHQATCGHF